MTWFGRNLYVSLYFSAAGFSAGAGVPGAGGGGAGLSGVSSAKAAHPQAAAPPAKRATMRINRLRHPCDMRQVPSRGCARSATTMILGNGDSWKRGLVE